MAVSSKNGYCSQVMLLDPDTGDRHYYRTSPNQAGGVAGLRRAVRRLARAVPGRAVARRPGPHHPVRRPARPAEAERRAHWAAPSPTSRSPTSSSPPSSTAPSRAPNAQVVINWATPDSAPDKPDDQDVFKHTPRADHRHRLAGRQDRRHHRRPGRRAGVRRPNRPSCVYDDRRPRSRRTPVDIPAESIVAADRLTDAGGTAPTPAVRDGATRYSLIGDRCWPSAQQTATVTSTPTAITERSTWPGPRRRPPPGCWRPSCPGPSRAPSPSRSRTCRWPGPGTVCWGCPR